MAIYTQLEYWHSILQHHEQFYIIFLDGSHFTWSKLMKIPMHLKYARLTGEYHKKFSFLTIYAILQYLGSISQYCIVIERKTWFELALHQNRSCAANFVGKKWIHNDFFFVRFLQLLLFWSSSVGLFWPFLGLKASQIPKYEPCHHKSLPGWGINPIIPIIFAFQACYSQKSIFDIFGGIKWPPLRPRELETSGYDA